MSRTLEEKRAYDQEWSKKNPHYKRLWHAIKRAKGLGREATLTLEEWEAIIARYGGRCAYCLTGNYASIDHVVPLSAGGATTKENCVPACWDCNVRKGGYYPDGKRNGSKGWVPHVASEFWPSLAEVLYA